MGEETPDAGRVARYRALWRSRRSIRWSFWIVLSLFLSEAIWSWFYYFSPVSPEFKAFVNDQIFFTIAITNYQALVVAMVYAYLAEPYQDKIDLAARWAGATLQILEDEGYTPAEVSHALKDLIRLGRQYGRIPESAKDEARHVFERVMTFTPEQWDVIVKRLGALSDQGIDYLENMASLSDAEWAQFLDSAIHRRKRL